MLDFLDNPVPSWLFYGFAILIIFEIRKYKKKTISNKLVKNKIVEQLNEEIFSPPKQEEFDLSKHSSEMHDYLVSFDKKNAKEKSRSTIDPWELTAKALHDFRFYQQFLNMRLPHGFLAYRIDDYYDEDIHAFDILRGRVAVARVLVGAEGINENTDDVGMVGNRPSVFVEAELFHTEALNYIPIKRLLTALAETHKEDGAEQNNLKLKLQVEECVSEHLWKLQQRSTLNQYKNGEHDYGDLNISITFSGSYWNYDRFLKLWSAKQWFEDEKRRLGFLENDGYGRSSHSGYVKGYAKKGYKRVGKD